MLGQKTKLIIIKIHGIDMALTAASFFVACRVRALNFFDNYGAMPPVRDYLWLLLLIIPIWSVLLFYFNVYERALVKSLWFNTRKIFKVVVWGVLIIIIILFIFKLHNVSRLVMIFFGLICFFLLSIEKIILDLASTYAKNNNYNCSNILVIGTGRRAKEIARIIDDHKYWGLKLIGFISDNPSLKKDNINGYRVIGKIEDLPTLISKHVVDDIIFAISRRKLEELEGLFLLCEEQGINARVPINFFPHMIAKVYMEEFGNVPLLTFTTTPTNEFALFIKRTFDVVFAFIMLMLLLPVFTVIAFLIKVTSSGPMIFVQKRSGLNGRAFNFYKFRSMYIDAEEKKLDFEALNEMDGPVFKMKNDPRITPIGRFLRRASLDELPQLWNVLRGDMSIIGPRPPLPEEVEKYERWQRRRLSMKPGITCIWQISGRSLLGFDEWLKLDLQYIDNWSLWLDVKILFKTIPAVLWGKGAY
jgi:exopolysaccharide biosynthesis polyprenyl glycosylphosphotransferase